MNQPVNRPLFRPDRGLEDVFHELGEDFSLPASASLGPAEMAFTDQIHAILSPPGMDDFLRAGLTPATVDSALLMPNRFRGELERVARQLRAIDRDPTARKALAVIDADLSLRALLSYYRNALLRG